MTSETDSIPGLCQQPGPHLTEISLGSRGRVSVMAQLCVDSEKAFVAEAGIGIESMLCGPYQKSRYDEQNAACRDLRTYKDSSGKMVLYWR